MYSQKELRDYQDLERYCKKHEAKRMAPRLFEFDGSKALQGLKDDPFQYVATVSRYTLKHAEKFGEHIPKDDPRRLRAYILVCINEAKDNGDTYATLSNLKKAFQKRFGSKADFDECLKHSKAIIDSDIVTSSLLNEAELSIAEWLVFDSKMLSAEIPDFATYGFAHLTDEQSQAVRNSLYHSISVLTGSGGTGKTEVIKAMILANKSGQTICLAPTGRASKRASKVIEMPAYTIHRALLSPRLVEKLKHVSLIIIDEVSMEDVITHARFLNVVKLLNPNCRVVLVGDERQLKSVSAGALLRDIIAAEVVPTVKLTKNFRQGDASIIAQNIDKILNNQTDLIEKDGVFEIVQVDDVYDFYSEIKQGYSKKDVIITPQNGTRLGVSFLNFLCQRWFNPNEKILETNFYRNVGDPVVLNVDIADRGIFAGQLGKIVANDRKCGKTTVEFDFFDEKKQLVRKTTVTMLRHVFESTCQYIKGVKVGDPVMHLENDIKTGLVNGDVGEVVHLGIDTLVAKFDNNHYDFRKEKGKIDELSLAYVYTCHKMQGEETDSVIIILSRSFYRGMVDSEWLATAVQRGRKRIKIIHDGCLPQVIRRLPRQRKTRLLEHINNLR